MNKQARELPAATGSPRHHVRRHKLRQHAASFTTGVVVFLVSIGAMQAFKPPPPGPSGGAIAPGRSIPAGPGPSLSGSSAAGDTGAGAGENEPAALPAPPAKTVPLARSGSTAAQIMGMPSVFIHVLDDGTRQQALKLAPALEKQGIALAGIKVVGAGPRASDLRYFRPSEKAEALRVQAALLSLGLPAQRLKSIGGFETSAVPRQYELWLASDYRG
nr:hypothetical protein [uncultured Noviherbaspirillum sp.]